MVKEKFVTDYELPEGVIRELLECLQEELAEVIHRICKAKRFGLKEIQKDQPLTNEQRIVYEFADVLAVVELLHGQGVLIYDPKELDDMINLKKDKLKRYLQSELN